jgi:hypothetical protein
MYFKRIFRMRKGDDSLVRAILADNPVMLSSNIDFLLMDCVDETIQDNNVELFAACETLRTKYSRANTKTDVANMQEHELIGAAKTASRKIFPLLYMLEQETRPLQCMCSISELQKEILTMSLSVENIDAAAAKLKYLNEFLQIIYTAMLDYKTLVVEGRDCVYRDGKFVIPNLEQMLDEIAQFYDALIVRPWVVESRAWTIKNNISIQEQIEAKIKEFGIIDDNLGYFVKRKTMLLTCYQEFCEDLQAKAVVFGNKEIANELGKLMNYVDPKDLGVLDSKDSSRMGYAKIFNEHVLDIMIRGISNDNELSIIINEFPKHIKSASNLLKIEEQNSLRLRSKVPISIDELVEISTQTKKQSDVTEILFNRGISEVPIYTAILSNKNIKLDFTYIDDGARVRIAAAMENITKAASNLEKNAMRCTY